MRSLLGDGVFNADGDLWKLVGRSGESNTIN